MSIKFKRGVVAGEFRLIHEAHKEMIVKAYSLCEKLSVIIARGENSKSYGTIDETKAAISKIIKNINGNGEDLDFEILTTNVVNMGLEWDTEVLRLVPDIDVIFNAKEEYENFLIKNYYLSLNSDKNISVTMIESNFIRNRHYIAQEFLPFMNKKIVFTGIESVGKTTLSKKVASLLSCGFSDEYGRYYAEKFLGGMDASMNEVDFFNIIVSQIEQNHRLSQNSTGILICDSDSVVTKYYMDLYFEEFGKEKVKNKWSKAIESIIDAYMDTVDAIIYLKPNVSFIEDGSRFLRDEELREIKNMELLSAYSKYKDKLYILENNSYYDSLDESLEIINSIMKNNN